ncbi:hypothetical protein NBRC111894_2006 [Sporolactobacillus inulinus]|uniref:Uncharacterized protein n=1 Tax=Sporolactobacillus inulinus TaxID=2078 RepID=A0A4Y1ZBJ2_9BACL|nr:hypothetical protein NBRC111894_2006 [Sporolactobacillus inulinus]
MFLIDSLIGFTCNFQCIDDLSVMTLYVSIFAYRPIDDQNK